MALLAARLPMLTDVKRRHGGLVASVGFFRIWLLAVLASSAWLMSSSSKAQTPSDHRCVNGADIRRIEIRFEDGLSKLPCRVIYRPETETDTVGIVSWRGLPDLASCEAQATAVIDRLRDEGWVCSSDQILDATAGDLLDTDADEEVEPPLVDEVTIPTEEPGLDDNATSRDLPQEEVDIPARLVDNPSLSPLPADLAATIERDLAALDTTLDGLLEAVVAGYGDLDGDELEDAVILYSYASPQPAYRQFLAAYMFDGETYQMRATRAIGGNINGTTAAKVEAIEDGVIRLSLRAFEPGDAACCPTGVREMAVALRDLDLVEIDAETLTR